MGYPIASNTIYINDDPDDDTRYTGLIVGHWNGWVVPSFPESVMKTFVEDMNRWFKESGSDYDSMASFEWDGKTVVMLDSYSENDREDRTRIEPDDKGWYTLDIGWCFDSETETDEAWSVTWTDHDGKRGIVAGWFADEAYAVARAMDLVSMGYPSVMLHDHIKQVDKEMVTHA